MRTSRAIQLADTLEREILESDLAAGSPYLTTVQAAQRFRVNSQTANDALRILCKRGILLRRRKRGTTIARLPRELSSCPIQCVHLLVHDEYLKTEGVLSDGMMLGLQGELPGSQFRYDFIPAVGRAPFAEQAVAEALRSKTKDGFVLVRTPLSVQRIVAGSKLPVVVYGSLQPSVAGAAWIDRDQKEIGGLLGRYLLAQGCQRIVGLFRAELSPGDFSALDELLAAMSEAGRKPSDFVLRALPADLDAIEHAAVDVLSADHRPTGLFCRGKLLADGAVRAVEGLGLRLGREVEIVIADIYGKASDSAPSVPWISMSLTAEEIGQRIGRMLAQQARHERVAPGHETIPVQLVVPEDYRALSQASGPGKAKRKTKRRRATGRLGEMRVL